MAKLVIKSSQLSVKQSNTPNLQALSISPNIYSKLGSDISQSGKVFEKIKADQRAIQDQNRSWEIISTKQKDIDKAIVSGSKLTDYDAAENLLNSAYEIDLSKESKGVQKLVNDYLFKNAIKDRSSLYKSVLGNVALQTDANDNDFLVTNFQNRISDDANVAAAANKDFESWFNNPTNKEKRDLKSHNQLKEKYEKLYIEAINNLDIERNPFNVILKEKEIIEKFGPQKGNLYLKKAQNQLMSDFDKLFLKEEKEINLRRDKQITIFTETINRIANPTDENPVPTFLELEDLKDQGSINTAQYGALVKQLMEGDQPSDAELINIIDNQIILAETTNELDDVNNLASSAKEMIENISVKDIGVINKLIDTFKQDPTKHEDYKRLYNTLKVNLNDLGGLQDVLLGSGGITPADKLETNDVLARFKSYVVNGMPVEQAYIKVIGTITQEKIPDVYSANLKPLYADIDDIETGIQKNPDNYFNSKIKQVSEKLANKEIKPEDFFEDVERIDMLRNVYNVRVRVLGKDKALDRKQADQLSLQDIFNSIKTE